MTHDAPPADLTTEQAEVVGRVRTNMSDAQRTAVRAASLAISAKSSKSGPSRSALAAQHCADSDASLDEAATQFAISVTAVRHGWRRLFGERPYPRTKTALAIVEPTAPIAPIASASPSAPNAYGRMRIGPDGKRHRIVVRDGVEGYLFDPLGDRHWVPFKGGSR
jgi:hypothetical protein